MLWKLIAISLGLGVGLAMDACAVSLTNGLNEPKMKFGKAFLIAAMFGFFQALMPMIGWVCVSLIVEQFKQFEPWIPIIALVLLAFIGGKMLHDGIKDIQKDKKDEASGNNESTENKKEQARTLTFGVLLVQAIATSIDALSTGFSLADIAGNDAGADWWKALISVGIIAIVTFGISIGSVYLGKKFGDKLGNKAEIVGGAILIAIGLEIFISGMFF
ncbi:MAG: manganese efflux pump [Clostridiales bacterium]|nr:manganese efflux pump [Clostridiales bacterium]